MHANDTSTQFAWCHGMNDPARTIENTAEPAEPTEVLRPEDSIAPLNVGDHIVQEIMGLMRSGEWDGRKSAEAFAIRHGTTVGSVKQWAVQAGRCLRLHSEPDQMLGYLIAKLHAIVEDNAPDRVPAVKTLLDQLEKMENRRLKGRPQDRILSGAEAEANMRELLRDPPPELERILTECWGERTVA